MTVSELAAADIAAFHALRTHWDGCCRSAVPSCLDVDKPSICEEGFKLYQAAMAAQKAYSDALTPAHLGFDLHDAEPAAGQ